MAKELTELLEEQNKAFEAFKTANDARLKEVQDGLRGATENTQKVEALNAVITDLQKQMDELAKKANRPDTAASPENQLAAEHGKAFNRFLRKGVETGLAEYEVKAALRTTDDADGGWAVTTEIDRNILALERDISPMRGLADVVTVGAAEYSQIVNLGGSTSGWVGEEESRTATDTPTLAKLTPYMGELYAMPKVTQTMLDDAFFNVEAWLAGELATEFAEEEGEAWITGTGVKKPKGIGAYTYVSTADATRTFGQLQYVASGTAGAVTADSLITLVHTLKAGYRANASFLGATLTFAAIRKLKAGDGSYLWQPSLQAGVPATLAGFPIAEDENVAAIASDALALYFGDFRRGYRIVDRMGTRVLRDPYTAKPYVQFYTTKRTGGYVSDSQAIKALKLAAS